MSAGRQSDHRDRAAGLLRMRGQLWLGLEVLLPESCPLRSLGDRGRGFELSAVDLDRGRRVGFEVVEPRRILRGAARGTGDDVFGAVLREEEQRTAALARPRS